MKFSNVLSSVLVVVAFSACWSTESPEKVAVAMCEFAKQADIKGMKELSTPEFAKQFAQIEELFNAATATEEGKAELAKQVASMSAIDCKTSSKITDINETMKQVSNSETAQEFKLTLVDGKWKVTN
ncbi:MAG: hypothetical protein PHU40_04610 [Sulfurimonas sp.]|nr:hypothetical protein [Sulfurimonas sp.]